MDDEGGAPSAAPDPAPGLADEIVELRKERDSLHDRLLRQAAEFDNYRKRVDRERRDSAQFAAIDFVEELLPVIDDFIRQRRCGIGRLRGSAFTFHPLDISGFSSLGTS